VLLRSRRLEPCSSPGLQIRIFRVHISRVLLSRIRTVIGITVIGACTAMVGGITTADTGPFNMAGMFLLITTKQPVDTIRPLPTRITIYQAARIQPGGLLFDIDERADRGLVENCFGDVLFSNSNTAVASRPARIVAFMDPVLTERKSQKVGHRNFIDR